MSEGLYAEQYAQKQYALGAVNPVRDPHFERTVEQNIDIKIAALRAEADRLEASKANLAPLLNMRLCDIREAMTY